MDARLGGRIISSSLKADPSLIPDIEAFEERAAIAQYDGGLTLDEAEDLAAQDQGFGSAADYWHWLATYVVNRGLA